jgi:site-specific DNA-cytosine methylase
MNNYQIKFLKYEKLYNLCYDIVLTWQKSVEYARIQTFPDEWQFQGSISSQYKQIGNAVPVNLAYHIGRCLIKILD